MRLASKNGQHLGDALEQYRVASVLPEPVAPVDLADLNEQLFVVARREVLDRFADAQADPRLDPLRDDPRLEELLRKQKLPEEAIQRHLALR